MAAATASISGARSDERQGGDDLVEHPLGDRAPVGDRLFQKVDHGDVADARVGARREAQLGGAGRQLHLGRQHGERAGDLDDALFGGDRQRDDDEVEARVAGEGDELLQAAETRIAGDDAIDAIVAAIVEHAGDADVAVDVDLELADELLRDGAAAVDGGAAIEAALARPMLDEARHDEALAEQHDDAGEVPGGEPDAREVVADLEEEHAGEQHCEGGRPGEQHARHLADERVEPRLRVEAQHVETGDGHDRRHGEGGHVARVADDHRLVDVEEGDGEAEQADDGEVAGAHGAADDHHRHEAGLVLDAEVGEARDLMRDGPRNRLRD